MHGKRPTPVTIDVHAAAWISVDRPAVLANLAGRAGEWANVCWEIRRFHYQFNPENDRAGCLLV